MTAASDTPGPSAPRTQVELMELQLRAIDAWNAAERAVAAVAETATMTREMRLDLSRRRDARRREHEALLARAEQQLGASGELIAAAVGPRAVLAHRNAWLRDKVAAGLAAHGVALVGVFEDGAEAAGTIVVEQPDLVFVEDRLPTMSGLQVVQRVRTFAPHAVVGAQVLDGAAVPAMVDAGAQAVFTRRVPPADIAEQLVACLSGQAERVLVG